MRAFLGAPPELDEAEQFAIATRYSFGYGPHPPLYQWIQFSAFQLFGVNYTAIALPKNAVLFGTYAILYLLGMHLTNNRMLAILGSAGLLLSVNFAWESQHDQSHTVSNTFLTVATTYICFKMLSGPLRWHYLALGICIGLWALAKYNFVFPLSAMVMIAIFSKEGRTVLKSPWILVTILLAIAIAAQHYYYILTHIAEATTKVSKLGLDEAGFFQTRLLGILAFLKAFIGVHAGWLLLLGTMAWINRQDQYKLDQNTSPSTQTIENTARNRHQSLFIKYVSLIYALLFIFVLIVGTTRYRDHWMQPAAVFAPLFLAICLQRYASRANFNRIILVIASIMPVVTFAYIFNNLGIGTERRDAALPHPQQLLQAIDSAKDRDGPIVVSDGRHRYRWLTAGHLRSYRGTLKTLFEPTHSSLKEQSFWLLWRARSADIDKAKNIYKDLRSIDAQQFSTPVAIDHFRPKELGKFEGTTWWLSQFKPE